jgi:hypothetical protein
MAGVSHTGRAGGYAQTVKTATVPSAMTAMITDPVRTTGTGRPVRPRRPQDHGVAWTVDFKLNCAG